MSPVLAYFLGFFTTPIISLIGFWLLVRSAERQTPAPRNSRDIVSLVRERTRA